MFPVIKANKIKPLSQGRGLYLPTQSQASYCGASSSPSARCPSSGFDVDNEKANARENVIVADGHEDVRASAAMTDENDDRDNADDGNFHDTPAKSLALYSGPHLLSTLISLLELSTPTSTSLALTFSLPCSNASELGAWVLLVPAPRAQRFCACLL